MKICQVKNINIGDGIPKICVPLVSNNIVGIKQEITELKNTAVDIVEWRMDMFKDVKDVSKVLVVLQQIRELLLDIPLLCTFRTINEGGQQELSVSDYDTLNMHIISSGYADIIDIELSKGENIIVSSIKEAKKRNVKVLLSNHDFYQTPSKEEIINRLLRMQSFDCDIAKIAVMPNTKRDVLTLLDATLTMYEEHATIPIVTMSMQRIGKISRLTGEIFGSSITFGSVKKTSAPGQMAITELQQLLISLHKNT